MTPYPKRENLYIGISQLEKTCYVGTTFCLTGIKSHFYAYNMNAILCTHTLLAYVFLVDIFYLAIRFCLKINLPGTISIHQIVYSACKIMKRRCCLLTEFLILLQYAPACKNNLVQRNDYCLFWITEMD